MNARDLIASAVGLYVAYYAFGWVSKAILGTPQVGHLTALGAAGLGFLCVQGIGLPGVLCGTAAVLGAPAQWVSDAAARGLDGLQGVAASTIGEFGPGGSYDGGSW